MIIRHFYCAALVFLVAMSVFPRASRAAQSYDNCNNFIDTLPATISTQGVWCLRHDLATNIASGNAIEIAANNVTIDCNDFKLGGLAAGASSSAFGINATGRQNATIRHCNIRGFNIGIYIPNGGGHLIEDNRLDNNLSYGIFVGGDNNLVQRNRVYDTGGLTGGGSSVGIDASADVIDNVVSGVFANATDTIVTGIILIGPADTARGNVVRNLNPKGNGYATGIGGASNATAAADNQVVGSLYTAVVGIGIRNVRHCMGNATTNFDAANTCVDSIGNLP